MGAKPVKIAGDPEGFDVVRDPVGCRTCRGCALLGLPECLAAPCLPHRRSDGRGVHYVRRDGSLPAAPPLTARDSWYLAWPAVLYAFTALAAALVIGACAWAATVKAKPLACPRCGAPMETKGTL